MTDGQIRKQVERELGRSLHDVVWAELIARKYVANYKEDVSKGDDDGLQNLVEEARSYLNVRRNSGAEQGKSEDDSLDLGEIFTDEHVARRQAVTRCTYWLARKSAEVRSFRAEVLGEKFPLTYKQALRYVDAYGNVRSSAPKESASRFLGLVTTLTRSYLWEPDSAAWFVLCDYEPAVSSLNVQGNVTEGDEGVQIGTISLTVDAWLPAKAVADIYATVQYGMTGRRTPAMVTEKRLLLLQFVTLYGEDRSWRDLMNDWNEQCPEEYRYSDVRNFSKACRDVARIILKPEYISSRITFGQMDPERKRSFVEGYLKNE